MMIATKVDVLQWMMIATKVDVLRWMMNVCVKGGWGGGGGGLLTFVVACKQR